MAATNQGLMTFGQLADEVGVLIEDSSAGRRPSIKSSIARLYDAACAESGFSGQDKVDSSGLRNGASSASTIKTLENGEAEFPLPYGVGRLKSLHHQSVLAARTLIGVDPQELFDRAGSDLNTTGTPLYYAEVGYTAQWRRLSAASVLTAYASLPNNDGSKTVRVVFRTQAAYTGETLYHDLTGSFSTGLSLAEGATFEAGWPIESVYLPPAWVGRFMIQTGSTEIVDIRGWVAPSTSNTELDKAYRRKLIRVWPVPSMDYGLTVTWRNAPRRLALESDVIEIPVAGYLVHAAAADVLTTMGLLQKASVQMSLAIKKLEDSKNQNLPSTSRSMRPKYRNMLGTSDIPLW